MGAGTAELQRSQVDIPPFCSNNEIKVEKKNEQESAMGESVIDPAEKTICLLSPGIRIIQYRSPAADCLLLCKPAAFPFVHIMSLIPARMGHVFWFDNDKFGMGLGLMNLLTFITVQVYHFNLNVKKSSCNITGGYLSKLLASPKSTCLNLIERTQRFLQAELNVSTKLGTSTRGQ